MKYLKNKTYILPFILLLLIFITSCHQRIELEYEYADFKRVVGPEGGTINYYEYNPQDSLMNIIVSLEIPEGALDSIVVFNMYEFYDEETYIDLYFNLNIEENSKFLYFVPFLESEGYNEGIDTLVQVQDTIEYHESIFFNDSVTVTYNLKDYIVYDGYSKLYRIKIPGQDEWGTGDANNIWINWNRQGYPNGYNELDLIYLITGRWTQTTPWGPGIVNNDHWEEVPSIYNSIMQTVTFKIKDTDYMYVMATDWNLIK